VQAGAPVVMPWRDRVSAVVYAYLGGQAGGGGLVDVLCGRREPGGRLAETFPHGLADNPVHALPFGPRQTEYRESVYVGYRWYDSAGVGVAYPFGHGLGYTTFAWSDAAARRVDNAAVEVSVTVTNTGQRTGSEVVQVYVHDVRSTVFRPAQELKGYAKVRLEPGESRRVTVSLDERAFAFWNVAEHRWTVEPGEFEIRLGASSRDIRDVMLAAFGPRDEASSGPRTAVLPATLDPTPVGRLVAGPPSYHDIRATTVFDRDDFAALLGRALPDNVPDQRGQYTLNTPIVDIDHPLARGLLRVLRWGARLTVRGAGPGSAAVLLVERTIDDATPRMLPMFVGRPGVRLARILLRLANRRTGGSR